jgi:hypothetical protein
MFYDQVSKYWPIVHDYILVPDYAGIRPKLAPPSYSYDASVSHDASITNYVGDPAAKVDMINTGSSTSTTSSSTTIPSTGTKAKTSTNSNTSMTTDQTYDIPSTSDFNIYGRSQHGIPNLVCLYGIESPGLTSSLAIGNYVRDILLADKT